MKITHIQLFDYAVPRQINDEGGVVMDYSYSANLVINNEFIVQISGDKDSATFHGVTHPVDAFWSCEGAQNDAYENVADGELEAMLEEQGFENNIGWLETHAHEIMNPEYAKYRYE
jgi:predicted extracellular nuclease